MIFPKKILTIVLIIVLVGLSVYYFVVKKGSDSGEGEASSGEQTQETKTSETPLQVKVEEARLGDLIIKLRSPAEAVTDRKIVMKAEVSGVIKNLNVEESKHVRKGDLLVELDDQEYRLSFENAEATRLKAFSEMLVEQRFADVGGGSGGDQSGELSDAKKQFEEAGQQYQKGLISREEFDRQSRLYEKAQIESGEKKDEVVAAMKGLTQAEINVKKAQLDLEKTKIRAPFSGIIADIQASPGEHVSVGRELFTLVNISGIKVHARVLESEIGKMQVGREVDLRFSAHPGKVFKGKVSAISPIVNPEYKTCKVFVDVENPEEELKPGMHAEVEIAAEIHKNKLLVPQDAILTRSQRKLLFVVEDGLAKWRYIEIGLENEEYAEVLDGVKEGEQVIVEGHFTLAHDARVKIVE
ncbi:MAG: efflux RND transporter periplasmic adaptor subunit [Candidatus Aminicenantes bacterium]|nr:efflux RND transporter periplasmic adaptor subunit [Candidatus Aminicenantes bacterium]